MNAGSSGFSNVSDGISCSSASYQSRDLVMANKSYSSCASSVSIACKHSQPVKISKRQFRDEFLEKMNRPVQTHLMNAEALNAGLSPTCR